jgi:uncharacterized protein
LCVCVSFYLFVHAGYFEISVKILAAFSPLYWLAETGRQTSVDELRKTFLTARWLDLLMLNYKVAPELLAPYVPQGTQLDSFEGKTYMSLVGFVFRETKLFGKVAAPFHGAFPQINLRFYVRRTAASEDKRGVMFIAEIVQMRLIALVAHAVYGEHYLCRTVRSRDALEYGKRMLEYGWQSKHSWCNLAAQGISSACSPSPGTLEHFLVERYWGYTAQPNGGCIEFNIVHPTWKVSRCSGAAFAGDPTPEYGPVIASVLRGEPSAAFLVDGSSVAVCKGVKIA